MNGLTVTLIIGCSFLIVFAVIYLIKEVKKFDDDLRLREIEGEQYFKFNWDAENEN